MWPSYNAIFRSRYVKSCCIEFMLNSILAKIHLIKSSPIGTTCCIFPGFQFLVSNEEKKEIPTTNRGKSKEFSDLYFYIFHKKKQKKTLKRAFLYWSIPRFHCLFSSWGILHHQISWSSRGITMRNWEQKVLFEDLL